jgi:hypothetical protein
MIMQLLTLFILGAIGIDLATMPPFDSVPPMNFVREIIGLSFCLLIIIAVQVWDWMVERSEC